jgi:hypothetical protein
MKITEIRDLKDMPDFNWDSQNNRGTWSTQDVTDGNVTLDDWWQKPNCIDHNAMNAVNPDRSIWRCLECGRACYMVQVEVDADQ